MHTEDTTRVADRKGPSAAAVDLERISYRVNIPESFRAEAIQGGQALWYEEHDETKQPWNYRTDAGVTGWQTPGNGWAFAAVSGSEHHIGRLFTATGSGVGLDYDKCIVSGTIASGVVAVNDRMPLTYEEESKSRSGLHRLYDMPADEKRKLMDWMDTGHGYFMNSVGDRIEVFADRCQMIMTGYVTPDSTAHVEIVTADRIISALTNAGFRPEREVRKTTTPAPASGGKILNGTRDITLTSFAGKLRHIGLSETEMAAALRAINVERCDVPLEEPQIQKIAHSVARYEVGQDTVVVVEEPIKPVDLWAEITEDQWFVRGLLPWESIIMPFGPPTCGKSTAIADLAVCVAGEKRWLMHADGTMGYEVVKSGPVVWYGPDQGLNRTIRMMRSAIIGHGLPKDIPIHILPNLATGLRFDNDSWKRMLDYAQKIGAVMIVFDVVKKVSGDVDENSADMDTIFGRQRELIASHPCDIFDLHHSRKTRPDDDPTNPGVRAMGSTVILGNADAAFECAYTGMTVAKSRDDIEIGTTIPWRLEKTDDGKRLIGSTTLSAHERIVREYLEKHGPLSQRGVIDGIMRHEDPKKRLPKHQIVSVLDRLLVCPSEVKIFMAPGAHAAKIYSVCPIDPGQTDAHDAGIL